MTTSKSGQSQALVPTGRQTNSCALACAKRSRENFLFDLDNKKSIESTQNVYPIWREAMSTHLAPFGLKTISASAGIALDTLEWSGPALFVSQTSSACRWKASPGLVYSPSKNHRLANPVIFSNNFELKSHVVRNTANFWHDEYDHGPYVNW